MMKDAKNGMSERINLQRMQLATLTMQKDAARSKLLHSEQAAGNLERTAAKDRAEVREHGEESAPHPSKLHSALLM